MRLTPGARDAAGLFVSGSRHGRQAHASRRKPAPPDEATVVVRDAIRAHVPAAIAELARLAHEATSETARVAAINALIDRGYGRSRTRSRGDDGAHGITVRFVAPAEKTLTSSCPRRSASCSGPSATRPSTAAAARASRHSMATALVLLAAQRPLRILAARRVSSARSATRRSACSTTASRRSGSRGRFASTETEIRGRNGSLVLFAGLASNPDSIKSMEGIDIAWVEEAATHLAGARSTSWSRRSASRARSCGSPGTRAMPTDPVDALFRAGPPPPDAIVRRVVLRRQSLVPGRARRRAAWDLARDPDKYAHIWDGAYQRHAEARVFRNWRIDSLDLPDGRAALSSAPTGGLRPTRPCWCAAACSTGCSTSTARPTGSAAPSTRRRRCSATVEGAGPRRLADHGRQRAARADRPPAPRGVPHQAGPQGQGLGRGGRRLPAVARHRGASALPARHRRADALFLTRPTRSPATSCPSRKTATTTSSTRCATPSRTRGRRATGCSKLL